MNSIPPGELMMIGFDGVAVNPAITEWITKRHVGGVILFSRNLQSMSQICKLIGDLQELRSKVSNQPLFIAIDQEGGAVSRLVKGCTVLPGNMALGAIGQEDSAYAAGRITAVEMGLMGFNIVLSPVMDLSCDSRNLIVGVRSFGEEPGLVGRLGSAMMCGLQENGVLAAAKHFPGLGHCRTDPHQDLPVVDQSLEEFQKKDLAAFQDALRAGAHVMMSAHAVYRCWEPQGVVPATFSQRILDGLLRRDMHFEGVVISDDLEMNALTKYFSMADITQRSVSAGVDMLLVCHNPQRQAEVYKTLQDIQATGGVSCQKMEQSFQRIRKVKEHLNHRRTARGVNINTLGIHHELAQRMARDSITLLRDETGQIPIRLEKNQKILLLSPRYESPQTQVEEPDEKHDAQPFLLGQISAMHPNTSLRQFGLSPSAEDFDMVANSKSCDLVILLTYNAHLFPRQMEFAKALVASRKKLILIALRNPYDLAELPNAPTAIATYGFRDCSLKALVEVLFGDNTAHGVMPVRLGPKS